MSAPPAKPARTGSVLKALLLTPLILAAHLVAALVFVVFMCKLVPFYAMLFEEWEMELPAVTQLVIYVSHLTAGYWYLMMLAVIVLDGAVLLAMNLSPDWLAGHCRLLEVTNTSTGSSSLFSAFRYAKRTMLGEILWEILPEVAIARR